MSKGYRGEKCIVIDESGNFGKDGKIYYLQENYEMATKRLVQLGNEMIYIDDKGVCHIVDNENEIKTE